MELHSIENIVNFHALNENEDPDNTIPSVSSKYFDFEAFERFSIDSMKDSSFSLFHCNIRSLSKHFDEFSNLLASLKNQFSVIGISETKLNPNSLGNIDLPDYNFLRNDSSTQAGGAGLYIHNSLSFIPRSDLNITFEECENIWIEILLPKKQKNIVLGLVYRHPNSSADAFRDELNNTLNEISRSNKQIVIFGDFNIDLIKFESHQSTSDYLDMLYSYFCFPVITQPTRVTEHSRTLIDHIYTNSLDKNIATGILVSDLSDHFPIFMTLHDILPSQRQRSKLKRNFKKLDKEKFIKDLNDVEWRLNDNVNESFDNFLNDLSSLIDKHVPLERISRRQQKLSQKPWLTSGILKSIKHKRQLYYKCFVKGDAEKRRFYKIYSNNLTHVKELSKRMYYKEKMSSIKGNVKETWKLIGNIIKFKSKKSIVPNKIVNNDIEFNSNKDIAREFNHFFRDIGPTLAKSISMPSKNYSEYLFPRQSYFSFFISPTYPHEVEDLISKLDAKKAQGPYNIPIYLIHLCKTVISSPLCHIFNLSFTSGIFPDKLKLAKVIPLYKSDSIHVLSNYRPISLLSPFSKILEQLMNKRMISFLESNDTFFDYQFGFRKGHSTILAITEAVDNLLSAIDNGLYTCGLFIDFSKAFDTVDHSILLSKLEHYGFRGKSKSWFSSYLSDRKQFVEFNGVLSDCITVYSGVPQGSVLGPLMFLIYINDINNCSSQLSFRLFADDTNVFAEHENLNNLEQLMNCELEKLSDWIKANKLSLNAKKSKFMVVTSNKKQGKIQNFTVRIDNNTLDHVNAIKFLGVHIDNNLTWKDHINIICKKISKNIGAISKLRHYVDLDTLRVVYYSLVYPYLQYGALIWGNTYKSRLKPIDVLNNKAVRIMTFSDYRAHAPPLYKAQQ